MAKINVIFKKSAKVLRWSESPYVELLTNNGPRINSDGIDKRSASITPADLSSKLVIRQISVLNGVGFQTSFNNGITFRSI